MQGQTPSVPASAPPDRDPASHQNAPPKIPATRVLVVEHRPRGQEPGPPSTTSRIHAFQPQTTISVAYSGWEALEILRHGPIRFDFVVIDANVGWMDPVDFVRRAQTVDPSLPAIITSDVGSGAVLVPPETDADGAQLLQRQVLRAVLRELRGAPSDHPAADSSMSGSPNSDVATSPA